MRIAVLTIVALALLTGEAKSGGCASYGGSTYHQPGYEYWPGGYWRGSFYPAGYYPPTYQTPIVLTQFYPVYVTAATFSTAQPAPALIPNQVAPVAQAVLRAPSSNCEEINKALIARITALEQRGLTPPPPGTQTAPPYQPQQAPKTAPAPQNAPMPPADEPQGSVPPGLSVAVAKCASCHDKSVSQEKAKGSTFFDGGKLLKLDAVTTVRWTRQLLAGKMPPKDAPQLTAEEMPAIMQLILEGK